VPADSKILKSVKKHAEFFADLAMQEYEFQMHPPSIVAVACIVCARRVAKIYPEWNPKCMEKLTDRKFEDVRQCYESLFRVYERQILQKQEAAAASSGGLHKKQQSTTKQNKENMTQPAKQKQPEALMTMRDKTNQQQTPVAGGGAVTSKSEVAVSKKQALGDMFRQPVQAEPAKKSDHSSQNETKITINSSSSEPQSPDVYSTAAPPGIHTQIGSGSRSIKK